MAGDDLEANEEGALAQALAELKAATEVRRRLPADSLDLLDAVRHEREVMERIWMIVQDLPDRGG